MVRPIKLMLPTNNGDAFNYQDVLTYNGFHFNVHQSATNLL
jgi:hypothetical protein